MFDVVFVTALIVLCGAFVRHDRYHSEALCCSFQTNVCVCC